MAAGPASIASVRRVLMQSWSSAVVDVTAASGIQVPRGEWERVWGPVGMIVTQAVGSRQSGVGGRSVRSGSSARSAAETGNLACGANAIPPVPAPHTGLAVQFRRSVTHHPGLECYQSTRFVPMIDLTSRCT